MPLYEVEVKTRVTVHAKDMEEAKRHAVAIASRAPITSFEVAASRSLRELVRFQESALGKPPIGK